MSHLILLVALVMPGCSYWQDAHEKRVALNHLIQAQANFLDAAAIKWTKGQNVAQWPTAWPFVMTLKEGEVSQFSLLSGSSLPVVGALLGIVP